MTKAGITPMKFLKKVFSVTLDTRPATDPSLGTMYPTTEVSWRDTSMNDFFLEQKKFYVDFSREALGGALQLANAIASKFNGHVNNYPSRSFGDGGGCKRKCLIVFFPGDSVLDNDDDFLRYVGEQISPLNVMFALGWESLFNNLPGSYQLCYDNNEVFQSPDFVQQIGQSVIVARNKAIIEIVDIHHSGAAFSVWLEAYNSRQITLPGCADPSKFTKLISSSGSMIWRYRADRVFQVRSDQRPQGMLPPGPADIVITLTNTSPSEYLRSCEAFCNGATKYLLRKGHTDFQVPIQVWEFGRTGTMPKVMLTFPSLAAGRAFYYTFRDYAWTNHSGTQSSLIKLNNATFQAELQDRNLRILADSSHGISATDAVNPREASRRLADTSLSYNAGMPRLSAAQVTVHNHPSRAIENSGWVDYGRDNQSSYSSHGHTQDQASGSQGDR